MREHVMRKGGGILHIPTLQIRPLTSFILSRFTTTVNERGSDNPQPISLSPLISRPTCRSIINVSSSPLSSFCNRHGSYPGPGVSQPSTMATTVPYSQPTGNNGSDMGNGQAPAYSMAPSGT